MSEVDNEVVEQVATDEVVDEQRPEGEVAELEDGEESPEEEAAASSSEDEQPEQRRSRAKERINVLTKEKYEAQKQAEALQQQLAEMQEAAMKAQFNQTQGDAMPTLADYAYDESAYQAAIQQWNSQQIQRYQETQEQQKQYLKQQEEAQKEQAKLSQAVARGQSKYPDFAAKVFDTSLPPLRDISPAAFQAVMDSDASEDVAYYLASNPDKLYSFASMTPIQAVKAVAKLEASLERKVNPAAPPPKPPSKVAGNSEAVKDPSKMSTAEWIEDRNRQLSKR